MAHRFYCETPSYGAGVGTGAFLKEGFCISVAEKGLGPEGSKPAVNNYRSWGRGVEASLWSTVQWKGLRPKARPLLIKIDMNPSRIARCAQLAMILEVSATPKPGNIDRGHNYEDTRFEHFLASAVGVYPILEKAAVSKSGIGGLIHKSVTESSKWQCGGNTHFGAFILLIPLVMAGGMCENKSCLREKVKEIVMGTTVDDAVEFYMAFSKAKVKVKPVNDLDLSDTDSINKIKNQGLTLYNMMEISGSYDMIAQEWVNGFEKTFECSILIKQRIEQYGVNDAVVLTFMELLSRNKDTFITTKFDMKKAEEVMLRARSILQKGEMNQIMNHIGIFDEELLNEGVNPGSTADIIISGLFVSLFEGMIF